MGNQSEFICSVLELEILSDLKINAGTGVDAGAVQHRAGVGDVRGRPRDQSGGLLHSGQQPRPDRPPVHPDRACNAWEEYAGDVNFARNVYI